GDAAARQIVRRDFDPHAIAGEHADAEPAHVAAEGGEYGVVFADGHPEGGVGEHFGDGAFELDRVLLGHATSLPRVALGAGAALPSGLRLLLAGLARLHVEALAADVLEHSRADDFALELLEGDFDPVVLAEDDLDHWLRSRVGVRVQTIKIRSCNA